MLNLEEIRKTLSLGWPIILGNLSQMILGIIDSAMVGAIHSSQLAAASFVNNLIALPLILCTGMATAISPLVAAALGQNNNDHPLRIFFNGASIIGFIALMMALGIYWGNNLVYHFGQDKIVADLARPYFVWIGWSIIPMALFMSAKQFADGLGKTRIPMYLSLIVIPLNILINYAFIFGKWGAPRMELEGAGVGTLVSRLIILVGILFVIFKHPQFALYRQHLSNQLTFKTERLRDIIRIGIPSSLQYSMESGAFAVSGVMAGWLGYIQQAAHQIAINVSALTFMVSIGISAAGSIRIAYAYGKNDWKRVRSIGKTTLLISVIYGLLCAAFFILGRNQLPLIFNKEAPVIEYAAILLIMAAIFQISDSVQAIGVGLLRGLQDVRIPTLLVFIAYWIIGIPLGYRLAFHYNWEIKGLWTGLIVGLSVSALLLSLRFIKTSRNKS